MVNLEDIKDQLRDQLKTLIEKIKESSLFNNLTEKYHTLPPLTQKACIYGSGLFVILFIFSIPYAYIESAHQHIAEFEENRTLLRELLRVGRAAKDPPPLPQGLSSRELQSRMESFTSEFRLLPEQVIGIKPLGERPAPSLAPPVILQEGVAVTYAKLNLYQILDIGYRLHNLSAGSKLTSVDIKANPEDNHYFDTTFKVVSFSLPIHSMEPETSQKGSRNRPPPKLPREETDL
ncbi:MAG: hypothetical protein K1X29_02885 [Bdellovibrionales bacterium]|nr:hypothetical protein [Bdellovibrionales bacterium]